MQWPVCKLVAAGKVDRHMQRCWHDLPVSPPLLGMPLSSKSLFHMHLVPAGNYCLLLGVFLQDQNLIVPSYMDAAGHMAHVGQSMTAALEAHMGIDPNLDPSMDPSMGPGLQPGEEEDQFGNGMEDEEEEDGSDEVVGEPNRVEQGDEIASGQAAPLSR